MKKTISIFFIVIAVGWLLSCSQTKEISPVQLGVFMVSYPRDYSNEFDSVYLTLYDIKKYFTITDFSNLQLVSLNNHQMVPFYLCDTNSDNTPEILAFNLKINPKEPLRPFAFYSTAKNEKQIIKQSKLIYNTLHVTYLQRPTQIGTDTLFWSKKVAETFMDLYPDACQMEIFAPNEWTYTNGFFTNALCDLSIKTGDKIFSTYAQQWIDCFVDSNGKIDKYKAEKYRLDDVLPGRTLLYLYEQTQREKYKKAADTLANQLLNQPKTEEGGYWHKLSYPHQMWLDGIYMGDVFSCQYASVFQKPEFYNEAVHQIKLIYKHTVDSVTGLLYHGWDESINPVWAHPHRGTSPEFWGRGMGWFMMALVDVLDYLPANHPERAAIIEILKKTSNALAKVQDANNHLWYQVLDKGSHPDNWVETSCSAMFAYAFAKGTNKGYLSEEFLQKANLAFNGLVDNYIFFDLEGRFYLTETVYVGTLNFKNSDGSFNYYIHVDRRINDFKGVAAFLYLAMALNK